MRFIDSVDYPAKFNIDQVAQEGWYLHFNINAEFKESHDDKKPVHVYIQFRKRDQNQSNLIVTSVAEPSSIEKDWYTASFHFEKALDLINGDYEITLVASDSRAYDSAKWVIGNVKSVFLNGLDEGNNLGIHD